MSYLPAFCDNCGTIFPSGFSFGGNAINISFKDCKSGPCPRCGQYGHVPDGVYNFIENTIELISGPDATIKDIKKLASILDSAQKNNQFEHLKEIIDNEVPALSSVNKFIPKNAQDLCTYIGLLLTIIFGILGLMANNNQPKIEVNEVINYIYQQNAYYSSDPTTPLESKGIEVVDNNCQHIKASKVGRNEKCTCGSGIKYKKCCGCN
jgi:hypothetical protein